MKIDRRITNGLAWAGVLLVVGVPAADLVSAQFMGETAVAPQAQVAVVARVAPVPAPLSQRPAAPVAELEVQVAAVTPPKPVVPAMSPAPAESADQVAVVAPPKPATITPAATPVRPASETADAVDAWLNSGKPLPSYITDESVAPTQVAVAPPTQAPLSTAPATPPIGTDPIQVASIPQFKVAPVPMPLSMRPQAMPVAIRSSNDLIVAPAGGGPRPPANVSAEDLADWESGPLSEFLAQRQAQAGQGQDDAYYDEDGFFLGDGPNAPPRRDRLIGPANTYFFPFAN
jgi:hypothetical protein